MAERNYNGPVIDCTWSNGPWSNDGETIEASDDNSDNGTMDTIEWPEGATPREELNDDQIAVITKAARYRNIDDARKLTQLAVGDSRAKSYAGSVLKVHWPERYWVPIEKTTDSEYIKALEDSKSAGKGRNVTGEENPRSTLNVEDVKEIRARAMNGENGKEIAESFPVGYSAVKKTIIGDSWRHVTSYPPLKYDTEKEVYVPKDKENWDKETNEEEKYHPQNGKLDKERVKELREEALNGKNAKQLSQETGINKNTISDAINGLSWGWIKSPPPLKYDKSKRKYVVKDGSDVSEQQQAEQATLDEQEQQEQQAQETPDYDPTPVTQESSTDYSKYLSIVAIVYMVYRVLRRLF